MKKNLVVLLSLLLLAAVLVQAQAPPVIVTFAGGGPNNLPALASPLNRVYAVAADANGNFYIVGDANRVYKIDSGGTMTVFAGNGKSGSAGDEGPAVDAEFDSPWGIAVDKQSNVVYIADTSNSVIRKVTPDGIIHHLAGRDGFYCYNGDGPAASTCLGLPWGLAVDGQGNLFVAEAGNNLVREITTDGMLHTVAGSRGNNGNGGFSGDGELATLALLNYPKAVAVDSHGNIFVADSNQRVRMFTVGGNISTVAGSPSPDPDPDYPGRYLGAYGGDGGPAAAAQFNDPHSLVIDANDNIFVADWGNNLVRGFSVGGDIQTVAGYIDPNSGQPWGGYSGDGTATSVELSYPAGLALDNSGNLLIADSANYLIRRVTSGFMTTVAGNRTLEFGGDGYPATQATLTNYAGYFSQTFPRVAIDNSSNLFISDSANNAIRKVDAATGIITTIAGQGLLGWGTYGGDGGLAVDAYLNNPRGLVFDGNGNLFFTDFRNNVVREIDTNGYIQTVAGNGSCGYADGDDATQAQLCSPSGVAVDQDGNLFIADSENCVIRKVSPPDNMGLRAITTVAGKYSAGQCGIWPGNNQGGPNNLTGDGDSATNATLAYPLAVAVDKQNNLFIADSWNNVIRRVDTTPEHIITTVAGTGSDSTGVSGGDAKSTSIHTPADLAVDDAGNIYFAEIGSHYVREVLASDGTLQTIAGVGIPDFYGDGGPAIAAALDNPSGLALDRATGNLYIYDGVIGRVRRVSLPAQQPGPQISISPGPVSFGNQLVGTSSDFQLLAISNSGTAQLLVNPLSGWFFPANPGDFTYTWDNSAGWCGLNQTVALDPGQSCMLRVRFVPQAPGLRSITVQITDNAPGSPHSLTLTGVGTISLEGALSISPASLNFGSQTVGTTTVARTITLTNLGGTTWSPNTIGPGANTINDFTMTGGSCITSGSVLVPGANCTVDVTFSPWLAGSRSGSITITDDSANNPYTVSLNGAGVLPNGVLAALPAGISPMRIAVNSNTNKMYVANSQSPFVTVIDGNSNSASNVDVGAPTSRVVVNGETNKIYFTGTAVPYFVLVMDGRDNSTTRLDFQNRPTDVVVDAVRNKIYVPVDTGGSPENYVAVIDGASNSMTSILLGGMPLYAAVNPVTNKIYVTMYFGNRVTVIDGAAGAVTATVNAQDSPFWVVVNPVTDNIYASSWNDGTSVTAIDGGTNTPTTITTGKNPNALAINTVTNKIYVANSSDTTITVINGNDNSTQTVDVGTSPFYVAVNEITNQVYVGNSEDKTVTVVDGATNATSLLPADRPWPVAVNPVTNTIYVGNRRAASGAMNGNVFVIQGPAAPAPLTVTANEQTMTYGSTVPVLTYTVTPSMPLDTPPICVSTATSSSYVDTYPTAITCSGASKAGYSISYVPAPMTVTKAELTIIFNDATKTYGQTLTFAGTEFTTSGLVNGDSVHGCTLTSPGAAATAPVSGSPYAITFSSGAWGSVGLSNYHNTYVSGTLTVTKAALTITAKSSNKIYGDVVTFAGVEFTTSGLINDDAVNTVTLTSAGTVATAVVSPYSIVPSNPVGTGVGNYAINYINGTLTVNKRELTVTANNLTKVYGQADPVYTVGYGGFVNGDTSSVVGGAPVSR